MAAAQTSVYTFLIQTCSIPLINPRYQQDAAYRPDNSKYQGCDEDAITYCRTDAGHDDHFCKFDGTNVLTDDYGANPSCYFNCQMETCNAWTTAHDDAQQKCVDALSQP